MIFDIVLPTIGRDSLENAIESVIAQTHDNWTLWVVGDHYEAHNEDWPNNILPLYVQGPRDDYGTLARNWGVKAGDAEWIAYIDDDDEWHPHHLTTLAHLHEEHPGATMLKTAGQEFRMKHKHPRSSKKVRKLGPINTRDFLTVGMAHTRGIFARTNGWQPHDNHDHALWHAMIQGGGHYATSDIVTFIFRR